MENSAIVGAKVLRWRTTGTSERHSIFIPTQAGQHPLYLAMSRQVLSWASCTIAMKITEVDFFSPLFLHVFSLVVTAARWKNGLATKTSIRMPGLNFTTAGQSDFRETTAWLIRYPIENVIHN